MANIEGLKTHVAKSGSVLSGSFKKHLNQYFSYDSRVQSMQIEVPLGLRKTTTNIDVFTDFLTKAINHLTSISKIQAQAILPSDFQLKIY